MSTQPNPPAADPFEPNADDDRAFNDQVRAEAYRLAQESAKGAFPDEADIKALMPVVRVQLMAERKKGILGKVAAAVSERIRSILGEKETAEQEMQRLLAVQRRHEELLNARREAAGRLKRAEHVLAGVKNYADEMRSDVPAYYVGTKGGGRDSSINVVEAYMRIAACAAAAADFQRVRTHLEAEVVGIDKQIAAVETENADLFS